jgi:hypothetical protein
MACHATRPPLKNKGWTCTGEDLTIILPASTNLPPVVLRRDLLPLYLTDKTNREVYQQFADRCGPFLDGGDHLHAVLPRVSRWRRFLLKLGIGS